MSGTNTLPPGVLGTCVTCGQEQQPLDTNGNCSVCGTIGKGNPI